MNRMTVPSGSDYVWEKMYTAIHCMCGKGALEERLADSAISALLRLEDHDLGDGQLREDLKYVLQWTKHNLNGERGVKKHPDDWEHKQLIEKMLHILLETHRDT